MSGKRITDLRKVWLEERLHEKRMDATNLARAINRDAGFVRDYLNGRKQTMSADAWADIERILGTAPSPASQPDAPAPKLTDRPALGNEEVVAAFETLLRLQLGSEETAREAAQVLLEVLQDPQSLPPGGDRDAAIRSLIRGIVLGFSRANERNSRT